MMKSKMTIEPDFDDNIPFIQVLNNHQSPDVRDKLLTQFRQLLGHSSVWLRVEFPVFHEGDGDAVLMVIKPVRPEELEAQSIEMANLVKLGKAQFR